MGEVKFYCVECKKKYKASVQMSSDLPDVVCRVNPEHEIFFQEVNI